MKKIINGKVYNTDTAKEIGTWHNTWDYRDFHYVSEALYQKRTGEYFLHGEGGPMTQYARGAGQNSWTGGEKIMPLTVEAARQWAEEYLDADDYAEVFGMPDKGDETLETLHVQLPTALMAKIRSEAAKRGISLRTYIEQLIRNQ